MMIELSNHAFQLTIDPSGRLHLAAHDRCLVLDGARLHAILHCTGPTGPPVEALAGWEQAEVHRQAIVDSIHGPLEQLRLDFPPTICGVAASLTFAAPRDLPAVFWKLTLHNTGPAPAWAGRLVLLDLESPGQLEGISSGEARLFCNGWQSWGLTRSYGHGERFHRTRLGLLTEPMRIGQGVAHPRRAGHFTSDMFGVLAGGQTRHPRPGLLLGYLSQQQHFGSLDVRLDRPEPSLSLWANGDQARLDPGCRVETDWACAFLLDLSSPDPLADYLGAAWRQSVFPLSQNDRAHGESLDQQAPLSPGIGEKEAGDSGMSGWCSWYQFYRDVTAEDMRRSVEFAASRRTDLPFDLVQLDDGFMTYAGDWYDFTPGFPHGLAPVAEHIRAAGFTPGLWLAPYIVDRRSHLAHDHPDWLLRKHFNRPVNAGFLHNRLATGLDLTHPQALDYTAELVRTAVQDWGFRFLKLDFLYAAALPANRRDPTLTRAQALYHGLCRLRQAAGLETLLLGCGCPLGPGIGIFDLMRIGADVDTHWTPTFSGHGLFFKPEPDMPSARNAIHNTLTRAMLHRRWWINDPDCLTARSASALSLPEVRSLGTAISLSLGLFLVSDDLTALSPERLKLVAGLLPSIAALAGPGAARPQVLDWLDAAMPGWVRLDLSGPAGTWSLLARFNWDESPRTLALKPAEFGLEDGLWAGREYWSGQVWSSDAEGITLQVPAHGVALAAVRRLQPDEPAYLGGDLHISQGLEVKTWAWDAASGCLSLSLERPGPVNGEIDLFLPHSPQDARVDGQNLGWASPCQGVYRFKLAFDRHAEIRIQTG